MKSTTLVLPDWITAAIQGALTDKRETAGVLLVGHAADRSGRTRLLARELHLVPEDAYAERAHDGLTIKSEGYVPALARAEVIGAFALWFHTHPGPRSSPLQSKRDRHVDTEIAELFRLRTSSDYYGTLICAADGDRLTFTGFVENETGRTKIDRLWEVGRRFRLTRAADSRMGPTPEIDVFDRNVRALGGTVQQVLSELVIGVIGCGGTGSAVAEQLVRLGVRHLTLVDPDVLSKSNLTRVYGSTPAAVGKNKAAVLATHLRKIADSVHVEAIDGTINHEEVARALIGADVIFGCTDDNAGRLVLSRLTTYLLLPVFDSGVLITSDASNHLLGIDGRVTVLTPGAACLVCRNRIDLARAQAEVLSVDELKLRQDEGYAPALPGVEPAVVTFTTAVAATAISELLERLIGFGPEPAPSEVLLRFHEREISTNVASPRPGHYCDPSGEKLGLGEATPFLEQTWAG